MASPCRWRFRQGARAPSSPDDEQGNAELTLAAQKMCFQPGRMFVFGGPSGLRGLDRDATNPGESANQRGRVTQSRAK